MARKLKVYQTSQGFYDLLVAAPTMKAALEAWGAGSNLFQQGDARLSNDSKAVAAATKKPGVVLRRPIGTEIAFAEQSAAPTLASLNARMPNASQAAPKSKPAPVKVKSVARPPPLDEKAEKKAAAEFEKERARREKGRAAAERAEAKVAARRQAAIDNAQLALSQAQRLHDDIAAKLEEDRASLDRREAAENQRWEKTKTRLTEELRKARE